VAGHRPDPDLAAVRYDPGLRRALVPTFRDGARVGTDPACGRCHWQARPCPSRDWNRTAIPAPAPRCGTKVEKA